MSEKRVTVERVVSVASRFRELSYEVTFRSGFIITLPQAHFERTPEDGDLMLVFHTDYQHSPEVLDWLKTNKGYDVLPVSPSGKLLFPQLVSLEKHEPRFGGSPWFSLWCEPRGCGIICEEGTEFNTERWLTVKPKQP